MNFPLTLGVAFIQAGFGTSLLLTTDRQWQFPTPAVCMVTVGRISEGDRCRIPERRRRSTWRATDFPFTPLPDSFLPFPVWRALWDGWWTATTPTPRTRLHSVDIPASNLNIGIILPGLVPPSLHLFAPRMPHTHGRRVRFPPLAAVVVSPAFQACHKSATYHSPFHYHRTWRHGGLRLQRASYFIAVPCLTVFSHHLLPRVRGRLFHLVVEYVAERRQAIPTFNLPAFHADGISLLSHILGLSLLISGVVWFVGFVLSIDWLLRR